MRFLILLLIPVSWSPDLCAETCRQAGSFSECEIDDCLRLRQYDGHGGNWDMDVEDPPTRRWFVLAGLVNVYPRLESEAMIGDILDPALRFIAPGRRRTRTFSDLRDARLMWPPQISVGRVLSEHFAFSMHTGYSAGRVRTQRRNPSIFLGIPLHSDIKINRYGGYLGTDLDYYPLGMVDMKRYVSWGERLRAARPTLGMRVTCTWAGYDASVQLGLGLARRLVKIRLRDKWVIPGVTFVAGVDVPLNERSALIVNSGYTFFKEQKQDFNGAAFTVGWRYHF